MRADLEHGAGVDLLCGVESPSIQPDRIDERDNRDPGRAQHEANAGGFTRGGQTAAAGDFDRTRLPKQKRLRTD